MPLVECGFALASNPPSALETVGPTLHVDVGFDPVADIAQGQIPQSSRSGVPALLDTGAVLSCIDDRLAIDLSLPQIDRAPISGAGGTHTVYVYLAHLFAPVFGYTQYGRFYGVHLADGKQPHQVLIGRSFLRDYVMIYDGVRGQVTLAR
jgi:hypothetical protein